MVTYTNFVNLPAVTGLTGTEIFPIVQAGTDKKATVNQLLAFTQTLGGLAVGTEVITGGALGSLLIDNGGTLGELTNVPVSSPALATLQLGLADAAVPVAQTLSVQNVAAGNSNVAGADWIIAGSKGTGSGAGGRILFQTAGAGGSGTSQNALSNVLIIATGFSYFPTNVTLDPITELDFFTAGSIGAPTRTVAAGRNALLANTGYTLAADLTIGWNNLASSTGVDAANPGNNDTFLGRAGAAALRLGKADAAAPVAQTLSVQSVITGTSNIAGVDWTFNASRSTGTGAGGRFIWQTTPAGGSGAAQNAFVQTLILDTTGTLTLTNGNGNCLVQGNSNNLGLGGNSLYTCAVVENGAVGFVVAANRIIGWSAANASSVQPGSPDTQLSRLSANCVKSAGAWGSSAPNTQSGTTYSMVAADSALIFSNAGAVTLTLLAAASNTGRWLYVKNTGAGTLASASSNVVPLGSATAGTAILAAGPGKFAVLESDGTNWIVMASN